jgi:hypothetical protein
MVALLGSAPRPVLPAVMRAAFRLLTEESLTVQEAADLLLPHSLRIDDGRPESVVVAIDALVDLGLIVEGDGQLSVDPSLSAAPLDDWVFGKELRQRVLAPTRNDGLFQSDEGTRELTKALGWFLAQAVDSPPVSYNQKSGTTSVTELLNEQFGSDEGAKSILQNSSRWPPFVRWAKYLGLISFLPTKEGGPCPNPAVAIREVLPDLRCAADGEIELPRLISEIAEAIPVLDGGSYRKVVEEHMDIRPLSSGDEETLSASLSLALLCLKDEGAIELSRASDSSATRMLSIKQGHRLPFSHVEILSAKQVAA